MSGDFSGAGYRWGLIAGVPYTEVELPLQKGDVVVFMADGIIEAHDGEGREYQDGGRLEQGCCAP